MRRPTWLIGILAGACVAACVTTPPGPDPRASLERGRELERRGHQPGALDAYRAASRADPALLAAHVAYQDLALSRGDRALLVARYRAARTGSERQDRYLRLRIDTEPARSLGLRELGHGQDDVAGRSRVDLSRIQEEAGRGEEARRDALAGLRQLDGDADGYLALGRALERLGRFEDAELAYRDALRHGAFPASGQAGRARVLLRAGRPEAASLALRAVPRGERRRLDYQLARADVARARGREGELLAALDAAVRVDAGNVRARRELGLLLFGKTRDPERASVLLAPLAGEGSRDAEVLTASGRLDLAAGRAARAVRKLEQAIGLGGGPRARLALLRARLAAGRFEDAATTEVGDDPEALVLRARAHRARGHPGEAEVDLRKALDIEPDRDDAVEELGVLLEERGRLDEALRLLADRAPTARTAAVRGRILLARQDLAGAEGALRDAVSLGADDPAVYRWLSEIMRRRRLRAERVRWLRAGLAVRPGDADLILRLVVALGAETEAESLVHELLRRDPPPAEARHRLARILLRRGAVEEGLKVADRAVQEQPRDPDARATLGDAFVEAGRPDEAAEAYDRALALDDRCLLARLGLARLLARTGPEPRAEAAYRAVIDLDPWRDDARREMARLLLRRGADAGAIELLAPVLDATPPDADALSLTALAHERRGETAPAIAVLERLRQLRPRAPDVHLRLGVLHKAAGNTYKALFYLTRAIHLGADERVVGPLIRELSRER